MDLNEILVFTRVVQAGSFTAAARLLDMPKSSVSRKVSELEDQVGARLIQRTTRKLGLTDAGRIYYQHSARIVAEIEEANLAVSSMESAPRGKLRVTAPLSFAMLGPIVAEFLKRHSDVQIDLVCSDRRVDLVDEGFDVAIRAGRLDDSTLVARQLGSIKRILVASPAYCKRKGTPRAPADLTKHDCITFGVGAAPSVWLLYAGEKKVEVRVTPRLTVNDLDILAEAARSGAGIAWMPQFVVHADLRAGRLKRVLPDWCSEDLPVQALYPTARHLSPKVVAFIDLVREKFNLSTKQKR